MEQLWELDTSISKKIENDTMNNDEQTNEIVSLDDFLEHNNESNDTNNDSNNPARKKKEDEFHKALNRLRNRLSTKGDDKDEIRSDTLVIVLENLDSITDLMELPFLAAYVYQNRTLSRSRDAIHSHYIIEVKIPRFKHCR